MILLILMEIRILMKLESVHASDIKINKQMHYLGR